MAIKPFLDSPDFTYIGNGKTYKYQEFMAMRPLFDKILNQKLTIVDEKYKVLDNSTVVYTTNSKWLQNYKDGHSILEDPEAFMFIFKKIDNKWRIIYWVDSYVEQTVKYKEPSKELNQVELMKKFAGKFKGELGKDTIVISEINAFGISGLEANQKMLFKDKILSEEKNVWGYDKNTINIFVQEFGKIIQKLLLWYFGSHRRIHVKEFLLSIISNPELAASKAIYEFKSTDLTIKTDIVSGKPVRTYSWTRIK